MSNAFLAFIFVLIILSDINSLKPTDTTDYLQVKCATGSDLFKKKGCEKFDKPGALLRITVNRSTGTVFMDILENNDQFIGGPGFFLDRCHVADFSEWRCGDTSITDKVDVEYGVYNGKFFQSVTGGVSQNIYTASIHGWSLKAYRYGLIPLQNAILWD
jgi:hypothetical protein